MSEKVDTIEDSIADSGAIISRASAKLSQRIRAKGYAFTKRSFDIFTGTIGTVATLPLLATVKAIYLINGDTAPIIYKQKRIGKGGEEFDFYKIRTMYVDADERLEKMLEENAEIAAEYSKTKKLKNDPRITKAGKFFRKSSLDEFPQFFNVLKGDMSMVGNRPYMPREKKDIRTDQYELIIKTKPGITGFWQVSGRSNVDFVDRVRMEAMYSENANLKMDTQIFARTFASVLKRDGAD